MEIFSQFKIHLDDNELVPGLRLFSKDRSLALAAWFSCLEPVKLTNQKNQLILEASENDKWLVTDLPEKDAKILNEKFLRIKKFFWISIYFYTINALCRKICRILDVKRY